MASPPFRIPTEALLTAMEAARNDSEKFATATSAFTDDDGTSYDKGAKGHAQDARQNAKDIAALGGIDGTVRSTAGLPAAADHTDEWWYVVDEGSYYTSDGSSWSETGPDLIAVKPKDFSEDPEVGELGIQVDTTLGGAQAFAFTAPSDRVRSSPTVADGIVYVGSDDNSLYAVDAADGSEVWSFTAPSGSVFSSPTVADGIVYVGSNDNSLYAVDAVERFARLYVGDQIGWAPLHRGPQQSKSTLTG
jgi:hypothetical protein